MINKLKKSKQTGRFSLFPGKDVYGELTLARQRTSLYLQDIDYFDTFSISDQCVKGVLLDLTKVTLIQCITTSGTGSSFRGEQRYHFASIFPHYVVYGDRHINPAEKEIAAVNFVVDDASTLFYDFDAFGILLDARPFIEEIAHANALGRDISTGPDPQILYFTGKREIFKAETVLGKVSASHEPIPILGSPLGVSLKNTIVLTINFKTAVTFNDAITHIYTILRYLEMLIGRPQNLLKLNIELESDNGRSTPLIVYWSMSPKRGPSHEDQRPHPADVLLDGVQQPAVFSHVLSSWLERQEAWRDARVRFSKLFANQHYYSIDRLIGSANMFDILPSSAVSADVQISEPLKRAKDECRTIFKNLPQTPERDSVLSALGRVGKIDDFPPLQLLNFRREMLNCI